MYCTDRENEGGGWARTPHEGGRRTSGSVIRASMRACRLLRVAVQVRAQRVDGREGRTEINYSRWDLPPSLFGK